MSFVFGRGSCTHITIGTTEGQSIFIVTRGQCLSSCNLDRWAQGSGIYRLREEELDHWEFARVGNPLARPKWARPGACGADLGEFASVGNPLNLRTVARVGRDGAQVGWARPPRISEGWDSRKNMFLVTKGVVTRHFGVLRRALCMKSQDLAI